jgi:hypothetical protein
VNPQTWEEDFELIVGTAIKVGRADDVVAGVGEGCNGHKLSALTRGARDSCNTAFEGCDALFEDIDRGL